MSRSDFNTLMRALSATQADLDSAKDRIQQLNRECADWLIRDAQKQETIERLRDALAEAERLLASSGRAPGKGSP